MHADIPSVSDELLGTYDVPGPRYTSYPTAPEWTDAFGAADYGAALARASQRDEPLSVYVHIPFCRSMCNYCGCNVIISRTGKPANDYIDTLAREIALVADRLGERREVAQVHFGGGTPTFLDEDQFARVWTALNRHFRLAPDAEATVEINPTVTRRSQLVALRALGVNRISLGVQDFEPQVQSAIGRIQTVDETRELLDLARGLGYESVNFDLIYGLPHQTPRSWARTLNQVVELAPDRLAIYSFAFVPTFKPHQRRLPVDALPHGRSKLDLFRQAWKAFASAGYIPVGMDHFAAPHDRLARAAVDGTLGRNFQGYTVRRAPETIAFGVSAISDIGGVFAQSPRTLPRWRDAVLAGRLPTVRGLRRTAEDERRRALITHLMCNLRVDLGPDAAERYRTELAELIPLASDGLLDVVAGAEGGVSVIVRPLGRLFLRNVAMPFDARLRERSIDERSRFSRTV